MRMEDTAFPPSFSWLPFSPLKNQLTRSVSFSPSSVVNVTRVPLSVLSSLSCISILIECSFLQKGSLCSPSPSLRYFILPLRFLYYGLVSHTILCLCTFTLPPIGTPPSNFISEMGNAGQLSSQDETKWEGKIWAIVLFLRVDWLLSFPKRRSMRPD